MAAGIVSGAEGDNALKAALVGSDALVLGAALAARDSRLSKGRVRMISLMGVVGTAFGFGIDPLAEVDSDGAALAIAGASSIAGLAIGTTLTKNYDRGKTVSDAGRGAGERRVALAPQFALRRPPEGSKLPLPTFGLRATF